jgi:hypothetical protein
MTNPIWPNGRQKTPMELQFEADAAAMEQQWQQFKPTWDAMLAAHPIDWEDTTK